MTTTLCQTIYKYYIVLIRIRDLIILFFPVYGGSDDTPDSGLGDQAGGSGFNELAFDFDFLQGLQLQDELGGSEIGGAPPRGLRREQGCRQEARSYQERAVGEGSDGD
jgi:hypothetical protein